jgi:poly-beta-1,6-N-acetyl-D-glucosamine synthase
MTGNIILLLTLSGSLVYFYYILLAWQGYHKSQSKLISRREQVSVVISARNEAHNIRELITRLSNQDYPPELYEVIIADDDSEDHTAEIIQQYAQKWQSIKLLRIKRDPQTVSGKKYALSQAINAATGSIILVTDADCQPCSSWIKSMVACFEPDTNMVAGFSTTPPPPAKKFLDVAWFEHFDFMAMFALAGGLILKNKYFSCSAQNLAYRKSSWQAIGGFSKIMHLVSGDDVNLMQLFRAAGMKIKFNVNSASYMKTKAVSSWQQLINQRARWASNTKLQLSLNPEFFFYLMSVLIITFSPWILLFFNFPAAISIIAIRIIIEMAFVRYCFNIFHAEKNSWLSYPAWLVIQPFYLFIVGIKGFFSDFQWK